MSSTFSKYCGYGSRYPFSCDESPYSSSIDVNSNSVGAKMPCHSEGVNAFHHPGDSNTSPLEFQYSEASMPQGDNDMSPTVSSEEHSPL